MVSPNRENDAGKVHVATNRVITFCNITIWQVTSGNGLVFGSVCAGGCGSRMTGTGRKV